MMAARTGNVEAMKVLLDHGADVNAKETLRGTTPLMWAADEGHAAAVQLLIERGADIKAQSNPAPRGRGPALGKANDPRQGGRGAGRGARGREASPDLGGFARRRWRRGRGGRRRTRRRARRPRRRRARRRGAAPTGAADDDQGDDAAVAAGFGVADGRHRTTAAA